MRKLQFVFGLWGLACTVVGATAMADQAGAPGTVAAAVHALLTRAAAGQGGAVAVTMLPEPAALPPCAEPQAFLPAGERRLLGTVTVGVRCGGGTTRYVQADIAVAGTYWVAAQPIQVGTSVTREMLRTANGNLAKLPPGAVLELAQAIGRVTTTSLTPGAILLKTELRAPAWVRANDAVAVVAAGPDFRIVRQGTALQSGPSGATVSVRFQGGRIVQGTVSAPGIVMVGAPGAQGPAGMSR